MAVAGRQKVQRLVAVAVGAPDDWTLEMREACLPSRSIGIRRSRPVFVLLLIGAALGGCSGGDFGRTRAESDQL